MTTVREAHFAGGDTAHAGAPTPPPFQMTQEPPATPFVERVFGVSVKSSDDAQKGLDQISLRWLKWLCLALLAFFLVVSALSLFKINARHSAEQSRAVATETEARAEEAGDTLGRVVSWMETAANAPSRSQMVALAAQGGDVAGAALVLDGGEVVVAQPAGYEGFFAAVPLPATAGIDINAVHAQDGSGIFATVSRPVRGGRLVVALPPEALSGGGGDTAVVSPSGRIVDGPKRLVTGRTQPALGLGAEALRARVVSSGASAAVEASETAGGKAWTGVARIPNSDLAVVHTAERNGSGTVGQSAIRLLKLSPPMLFCNLLMTAKPPFSNTKMIKFLSVKTLE